MVRIALFTLLASSVMAIQKSLAVPIPDGTYYIESAFFEGRVITGSTGSTQDNILLLKQRDESVGQQYEIINLGENKVRFRNPTSGLYISHAAPLQDGNSITMETKAQDWLLTSHEYPSQKVYHIAHPTADIRLLLTPAYSGGIGYTRLRHFNFGDEAAPRYWQFQPVAHK